MSSTAVLPPPAGEILREWRSIRGLSQLDLALSASVSARHLSFIETGRSSPSRRMVVRLAEALDLPLRERNALLVAAGFAPLYGESDLGHTDLAPVRRALERILASHEPYPAFVLDSAWNVRLANRAHERLLATLLPEAPVARTRNVMRLIFDPALLRPCIANWELVAHVLGHRVRRRLRAPHLDPEHRRLFEELLAHEGVKEAMLRIKTPPESAILIPLDIDLPTGQRLSWFSTIATIGTPQDVTLEELQLESLFPADDATDRAVRAFEN